MVLIYCFFQKGSIRVIFRYFGGIVSQDQMILEWPLKGLTHQVLKCDDPLRATKPLLNLLNGRILL